MEQIATPKRRGRRGVRFGPARSQSVPRTASGRVLPMGEPSGSLQRSHSTPPEGYPMPRFRRREMRSLMKGAKMANRTRGGHRGRAGHAGVLRRKVRAANGAGRMGGMGGRVPGLGAKMVMGRAMRRAVKPTAAQSLQPPTGRFGGRRGRGRKMRMGANAEDGATVAGAGAHGSAPADGRGMRGRRAFAMANAEGGQAGGRFARGRGRGGFGGRRGMAGANEGPAMGRRGRGRGGRFGGQAGRGRPQ